MSGPRCQYCEEPLVPTEESIPESIICYKAGQEDPTNPANRIVTSWYCPLGHGGISPGGGVCGMYSLEGGPWNARELLISPPGDQLRVWIKDAVGVRQEHEYVRKDHSVYTYKGVAAQ